MNYERGRKRMEGRNERRWMRDWGRMWRTRRELLYFPVTVVRIES